METIAVLQKMQCGANYEELPAKGLSIVFYDDYQEFRLFFPKKTLKDFPAWAIHQEYLSHDHPL